LKASFVFRVLMGETRTRVVEGREAKLVGAKVESKAASSIRRKFRKEGEAAHGKEKSGGGGGGVWSTGRNSKCVCVLRKVLRNPPVSSSPTQFPSNLLVGSERALGLGSKKWEEISRPSNLSSPLSLFFRFCLQCQVRVQNDEKVGETGFENPKRNPFLPKPSGHPKKSSVSNPTFFPSLSFFVFASKAKCAFRMTKKLEKQVSRTVGR